jgi:hypothetical protein
MAYAPSARQRPQTTQLYDSLYSVMILQTTAVAREKPQQSSLQLFFFCYFCNPILFAICTSTFSILCKDIQWHVEECSLALLYNNRFKDSCGFRITKERCFLCGPCRCFIASDLSVFRGTGEDQQQQ